MRVFLSYSEKDKATVDRISRALQKDGIEIWRADKDIAVGGDLSLSVRQAMKRSDLILPILSKDSVSNMNVMSEIYWALSQLYQNERQMLFPIVIDRHIDIPPFLASMKYYYLDRSGNIESEVRPLLAQLRAISHSKVDYEKVKQAQIEHLGSQRRALKELAVEAEARKAKKTTLIAIYIAVLSVLASVASLLVTSRLLADLRLDLKSLSVGLLFGLLMGSAVSAIVVAARRRGGKSNG